MGAPSVEPDICSTTHHTFLIGPWPDAGVGAVRVTQLDDPDEVVLILKPIDVLPFVASLLAARNATPVPCDVTDLSDQADYRQKSQFAALAIIRSTANNPGDTNV